MARKTPKQAARSWPSLMVTALGSNYFFIFILVVFLLQTAWIALSAIYPMLFDEEYHLGIIEIYSRQLSPFITMQPPEAAFHGDITRYSSYLFHYLMSFPYRLITLFTSDLMTVVIVMRFICIGLVITGLWLFKKALRSFGVSNAVSNVALLVFTFIPLVPFALAQINYDALMFVWVPLLFYLSKKASVVSPLQAWFIALLVAVSCLAAVTKFTALPIIAGCFIFVGFYVWRQHGAGFAKKLARQYKRLPRLTLILTSLLLLISLGLVAERYGFNLVTYRALEPACDRLHTTQECLEYTVFKRNHDRQARYEQNPRNLQNPAEFTADYWAPHIFGDFFVTAAFVYREGQGMETRYLPPDMQASAGNVALKYSGTAIFILSVFLLVAAAAKRKLRPAPLFGITLLVLGIYASSHWIKNYSDYLTIGSGTAAQGRYYIPLLIFVLVLVALSLKRFLPGTRQKLLVFFILLLPLTQGGGVANYILYSNEQWYWPAHRQTIKDVNVNARQVLRSFTPL